MDGKSLKDMAEEPKSCLTNAEEEWKKEMYYRNIAGSFNKIQSTAVQGPLKDSGQRREFATGSVRDVRTGKGRFDLISPIALRRLAVHLENGMTKYGERNWEKGQPLMSYMDSALRHLNVYIEGDRSEDHLAAAMWNIHCFIHTEEMINRQLLPGSLDDRPAAMM